MDREARDQYLVVVQAKDMLGLSGGYSASTTVTVSLTDVNDNGPTFQHRESQREWEEGWSRWSYVCRPLDEFNHSHTGGPLS